MFRVRAETKHIPFAGFMSDDQKPLFPDFEQITLEGHAQGEVWLLHKQSKSLFTTDTITHHFPTDIWFQVQNSEIFTIHFMSFHNELCVDLGCRECMRLLSTVKDQVLDVKLTNPK